jgi:hypothetical protein
MNNLQRRETVVGAAHTRQHHHWQAQHGHSELVTLSVQILRNNFKNIEETIFRGLRKVCCHIIDQ